MRKGTGNGKTGNLFAESGLFLDVESQHLSLQGPNVWEALKK